MAVFSISDLAKLSGIKAPTLRVWEQRYGVLNPKRTDTNARYYDDEDVRHLLNVALLNKNGIRISVIAKMSEEALASKVAELTEVSDENASYLDGLSLSMLEMDELRFDRILSVHIEQLGFESALMTVVIPFLDKVSALWVTGSIKPIQERFISGLIRRKLLVEIDKLEYPAVESAPKLLLFLPEGESQEMSLLLLFYLARKQGYNVYYLGKDVGSADLADAAPLIKPQLAFTMITETQLQGKLEGYTEDVLAVLPESILLLSGYQAMLQRFDSKERLEVLASMQATLTYLATYKDSFIPE